jgi:protein-tyrosine-phosphatase
MAVMILLVGGADTSRAPMAAALLRRRLAERYPDWTIESAGVLGHDGDPAEPEARDALTTAYHLDIGDHTARSINADLVAAATLLVAVDTGTARVLQLHYPDTAERTVTLGELAGRRRDIPDPFRMQLGAWISYAREIDQLLHVGLGRLVQLVSGDPPDPQPASEDSAGVVYRAELEEPRVAPGQPAPASAPPAVEPQSPVPVERRAPVERCVRLLTLMREMPTLVEWPNARRQLEAELKDVAVRPTHPDDLVQPYTVMLLTLLGMSSTVPSPGQLDLLQQAFERLYAPIDQQAIATLSAEMTQWATL